MTTKRFSFTVDRLTQIAAPTAGATCVYDANTPALTMRVTKAGAKTFVFYRRLNRRPERITLGGVGVTVVTRASRPDGPGKILLISGLGVHTKGADDPVNVEVVDYH